MNDIDNFQRNQQENITQHDVGIPIGLPSETRKLCIKKIKELEAEYDKLPYMIIGLSIEQEQENSEKRIELFNRIKGYKNLLSE